MEGKKILKSADRLIKRILKLLIIQAEILHKQGLPPQRISDLQRGQVVKGGLYVPLSSIEHRIMIDGYETTFVENFISLYKSLYKSKKNNIAQFSLRTATEMGFQRCQILFSKTLSKDDIETFKLVAMLGDYGFLAPGRPEHLRTFERLLLESGNHLTENQKKLFINYVESIKTGDTVLHASLTKKTRKLVDTVQYQMYKKTPILPFFKTNVIDALFSSFSHIVHGNILLLIDVFSPRRPTQLLLRVYWVLLLTGINMVNHISEHLGDPKIKRRVKRLNKSFDIVAKNVQTYWASI